MRMRYKAHLETAHFQRFRTTTEKMVKSRKLLDAVPIMLVRNQSEDETSANE
jgi:quinol monooxygenase YgiN